LIETRRIRQERAEQLNVAKGEKGAIAPCCPNVGESGGYSLQLRNSGAS
jgi:hypothetical protein